MTNNNKLMYRIEAIEQYEQLRLNIVNLHNMGIWPQLILDLLDVAQLQRDLDENPNYTYPAGMRDSLCKRIYKNEQFQLFAGLCNEQGFGEFADHIKFIATLKPVRF